MSRDPSRDTSRIEMIGSAIMIWAFLAAALTDWPTVLVAALLQAVRP